MRRFALTALAFGAMLASPTVASPRDDAGVVVLQTVPTALRADAAYILLRTNTAKSGMMTMQHVFVRAPGKQELEDFRAARKLAYEKELPKLVSNAKGGKVPTIDEYVFPYEAKGNSFVVEPKKFLEDGEMRTILLEVPPGTYILYGSTLGGQFVVTCNCLGTVSFEARAGMISDIGSLYVDKVHKESPVPHLEDNLGPQMFQYGLILGQALVPADKMTPVPAALRVFPIEPARFAVVGQYYSSGNNSINRLAPMPGLLGYERGRPVDLRTGQVLR